MTAFSWRDRRVVITGVTGFKGSWLALWLRKLGAQVSGYALAPATTPSLFELAGIASEIDFVEADIRDLQRLRDFMRERDPEIVFHLAAQSLVLASYADPVGTYATNVMGTVHVLEALRDTNAAAAVMVTSDKCYENREWLWGYRENEALGGLDPYSSSKASAEIVTAAYRASFFKDKGPRIASARAGNVIGGGDWAEDRLLPDAMRAFLAGKSLLVRNPHALRPWQHVLEPVYGYIRLAEALCDPQRATSFAEAWNFGPYDSDTQPVAWVVDRIAERFGGAQWVRGDAPQPHEARLLKLDSSKSRARLGVAPRLTLQTAIDWTVDWYRQCAAAPSSARDLVVNDIARFEGLSS